MCLEEVFEDLDRDCNLIRSISRCLLCLTILAVLAGTTSCSVWGAPLPSRLSGDPLHHRLPHPDDLVASQYFDWVGSRCSAVFSRSLHSTGVHEGLYLCDFQGSTYCGIWRLEGRILTMGEWVPDLVAPEYAGHLAGPEVGTVHVFHLSYRQGRWEGYSQSGHRRVHYYGRPRPDLTFPGLKGG